MLVEAQDPACECLLDSMRSAFRFESFTWTHVV